MTNETAQPTNVGSNDQLGAVLTYTSAGLSGVHGMSIGAGGEGSFAVVFMGEPVDAENAANEYLRRLRGAGHRITAATVVANFKTWGGSAVRVLSAPLPGGVGA